MYTGAGLALGLLALTACKKESTEPTQPETPTLQQVLSVPGGTFHTGAMPQPTGDPAAQPQIAGITGNSVIIPGGSVTLTVDAQDPQGDLSTFYLGAEGLDGYYTVDVGQGKAYQLVLILSQSITQETLRILLAAGDAAGNIGNFYTWTMIRTEVGTGKLQVSLSWDQPNDVDLHLVEPTGEEIYYGNPRSSAGGYLDLDSNAACAIDSVNNENITYPDSVTLPAGTYIVRVDFWSDCGVSDTTHYTVTARLNGELIAADSGSNPYTGSFPPGTSDGGGAGSGVTVMTFTITGNTVGYLMRFPKPEGASRPIKTRR